MTKCWLILVSHFGRELLAHDRRGKVEDHVLLLFDDQGFGVLVDEPFQMPVFCEMCKVLHNG